MNNTEKISRALSSDELWAKAANGGSISREELGIGDDYSSDGMTTLNKCSQRNSCTVGVMATLLPSKQAL